MSLRTRFAPSPTGFLHIGGVRTALFNWLLARRHGGQFVLRIDDTDHKRHVEEAVGLIIDGFRWIGMDIDEGPFYQSQRSHLYAEAARKLVEKGLVYRDYSNEAERAAEKAAADKAKTAYRFRRKPYSDEQLKQFEAEGRPYALRFEVPLGRTLVLPDLVKGPVETKTEDIGDFVIVRPDGGPLYNFASAIDDIDLGITHIVRAEEHLTNTFSQLLVLEALLDGAPMPAFAHIPFVAKPGTKTKLSKRDGAVGLDHYIEMGYLPEGMMNYLARLGWAYDDVQEIFSPADLIEKFSLEKVNSSPAAHDPDKLFWVQGEWMKRMPMDRKLAGVLPYLRKEGLIGDPVPPETIKRVETVIEALGDRLKVFSDILKLGRYFFAETPAYDPDAVKKRLRKPGAEETLKGLDRMLETIEPYDQATLEKAAHDFAEANGIKMGDVVNPLRVAITGQAVGPGLYDCLTILGRETSRARIASALAMLSGPVA